MPITRRDFLKLSSLSLTSLALRPFDALPGRWLADNITVGHLFGRVTRQNTPLYAEPDHDSPRLGKLARDELLNLLEELDSPSGPPHNPRWYRLEQGYVHSAYIQRIESIRHNRPLQGVPARGFLGEITVPYTQTTYKNRLGQWLPLYRLYYGSLHWVTALEEGPGGEVLYRLYDDWLRVTYRAPAEHIRPLANARFRPLSAQVPAEEKRLEVSIERQALTAYEGRQIVREAPVSTGRRWTPTPLGEFRIDRKHPARHMGNGGLTSDPHAYELVGVPWVSFFQSAGIAFHGTFWHDNFGEPMSLGCVNLRTEDALWLFRWSMPVYQSMSAEHPTYRVVEKGGTQVVVV
jgi:lipoprotein-anchoring transpeptidase ErfK/SrfK